MKRKACLHLLLTIVCVAITCSQSLGQNAQGAQIVRGDGRRHLIVCVDGVGFSMIQQMRRAGHFSYMREPSRMIAPFPTLTNVAMTEIMRPAGADDPAGYEDSFYDADQSHARRNFGSVQ